MKKIILAIACIATIPAFSQTTMQEYNYMTTGYQIQVKTGQDINKGYRVFPINKYSVDFAVSSTKRAKRISEFSFVYNDNSVKAPEPIGILIKMYRDDVVNDTYFFMPNKYATTEVLNKAVEDYTKIFKGDEAFVNYTWNITRMLCNLNTK